MFTHLNVYLFEALCRGSETKLAKLKISDFPANPKHCTTVVQRRPNVFDVGPTLYKCYTNVLCLLTWCFRGLSSRILPLIISTSRTPWIYPGGLQYKGSLDRVLHTRTRTVRIPESPHFPYINRFTYTTVQTQT